MTFTSTRLLEDLRDADSGTCWQELDRRVRPILFGVARRLGLDEHAAADVVQETLLRFVRLYRENRYDRERGGLRAWIVGIARHRIAESRRQSKRQPQRLATEALMALEEESEMTRLWDEEARATLVREALETLERASEFAPSTLTAFRRVCLEGHSPRDVARDLGLTENAVYLAKFRCLRRMREVVSELEQCWEVNN